MKDFNVEFCDCSVSEDEGERLLSLAYEASKLDYPAMEIGSYIGTSTIFLGKGMESHDQILFSLDTHRGSKEHEPGGGNFNSQYYDEEEKRYNTFPVFERNIAKAGLLDVVVPIVSSSALVAERWSIPLSLLFIDGEHDIKSTVRDYKLWAKHIIKRGVLILHDVFPEPFERTKNGRREGPSVVYDLVVNSNNYKDLGVHNTLGIFEKL